MNGPIAQIVALTCHGNAWLSGHDRGQFFSRNSTCQFCEFVRFVARRPWPLAWRGETPVADSPDAWFGSLEFQGARGIRLVWSAQNVTGFPDRMLAGLVGGGGTWIMEVVLPARRTEWWEARWEVGDRNAPGQRIWRVTYIRVARRRAGVRAPTDLPETSRELLSVLREIESFATRHGLAGFSTCFQNAIDTIESIGKHRHGYHQDLAPDGALSDRAFALLDACQQAWVFGGMGSWNDLAFEDGDQRLYERLSEDLFAAVTRAIAQAATSSFQEDAGDG